MVPISVKLIHNTHDHNLKWLQHNSRTRRENWAKSGRVSAPTAACGHWLTELGTEQTDLSALSTIPHTGSQLSASKSPAQAILHFYPQRIKFLIRKIFTASLA